MDFGDLYFSSRGRLNRKGYWLANIGLIIFILIFSIVIGAIVGMLGLYGEFSTKLMGIITMAISIVPVWCVIIKRLHDRGRPENLALIFLTPSVVSVVLKFLGVSGTYQKTIFLGQETIGFIPNIIGTGLSYVSLGIGIWALIELGILPGQTGENDHGPDPSA